MHTQVCLELCFQIFKDISGDSIPFMLKAQIYISANAPYRSWQGVFPESIFQTDYNICPHCSFVHRNLYS